MVDMYRAIRTLAHWLTGSVVAGKAEQFACFFVGDREENVGEAAAGPVDLLHPDRTVAQDQQAADGTGGQREHGFMPQAGMGGDDASRGHGDHDLPRLVAEISRG